MSLFSKKYIRVISSQRWKMLKAAVIKKRGHRCERCGCEACSLDLHHKNYDTLGRERHRDVDLLCRPCHVLEDKRRKALKRVELARERVFDGVCTLDDFKVLDEAGHAM